MATITTHIYPEHVTVANSTHHALIAGATGSGKSTFLHGVITSILTKSPNECQLVLIDPKRVELNRYKNTQHCIAYECEAAGIERILNNCLVEVERRYKEMVSKEENEYKGTKICIVVEELADVFYMSKPAYVLLERLARIARAANVQIIAATQCILSEVIPTRLKMNLDLRVALPVATAHDSRIILDTKGAESLILGEAIIKIGCSVNKVTAHRIDDTERKNLIAFRHR